MCMMMFFNNLLRWNVQVMPWSICRCSLHHAPRHEWIVKENPVETNVNFNLFRFRSIIIQPRLSLMLEPRDIEPKQRFVRTQRKLKKNKIISRPKLSWEEFINSRITCWNIRKEPPKINATEYMMIFCNTIVPKRWNLLASLQKIIHLMIC